MRLRLPMDKHFSDCYKVRSNTGSILAVQGIEAHVTNYLLTTDVDVI